MGVFFKRFFTGIVILSIAFAAWVYFTTFHPASVESIDVHNSEGTPVLDSGQQVRVLSWNVQFMAGNDANHFFYDDGPDPWPDEATVARVTRQVAEVIRAQDPDVVLLQEVDDVATRTYLRDQTQQLLEYLPEYSAHAETFYWKASYLPHPAIQGRVGMKLVALSKYRIDSATRYALSPITTDDVLTRQFNLKRAMLQIALPVRGADNLTLINTHLSAFAQGSDTMERQIAQVLERLESFPGDSRWLLAGDFNLLPNAAALEGHTELRSHYNEAGTELTPLISRYPSVPALDAISTDPEPWYTYMSPIDPERRPDRTIDYVFYSPAIMPMRGEVLRGDAKPLSDHLPIVVEFQL